MTRWLAVIAAIGCSSKSDPPADLPPLSPPITDAAPAAEVAPVWLTRIPGEPGLAVLESTAGPVLAGEVVVVASSAIGFAAVDWRTGAVSWQHRGEQRPYRPVVIGDDLLLPGRCSHRPRPAQRALACVDRVDPATGRVRRTDWIVGPAGAGAPAPVGLTGAGLLWSDGVAVWTGAGEVIARGQPGDDRVYAASAGDPVTVVRRQRIDRGDRSLRFREPAVRGVAGPVEVGGHLVAAVDDHLEVWRLADGRPVELDSAVAHYRPSFVAGALVGGDQLLAVGLQNGVHPDRITLSPGRVDRGEPADGVQLTGAAWLGDRSLVAAIRVDASLYRDTVARWGADLRRRWVWPVPAPPEPRLDPVGLAAAADGVAVFWNGRELARLPL